MSRIGFSQARTGRSARRSNFDGVDQLEFEPGKNNRLIIPLQKDKEGNLGVVLFGQTIHRLNNRSIIQMPRKTGGHWSPFSFRCTHPYGQQNPDDSVKFAKREEMCVLCELEQLQNRRRMEYMKEEYPSDNEEDEFENFKKLTNKEKKAFFKENELDVEASYFTKTDEDGEEYNERTREMSILAIELETETIKRKMKNSRTGKVRTITETVVKKDDNGNVVYKPVLFKVSGRRLNDFKVAVDNALQAETLSFDNVHPYIENEGTEAEEEINIGWIDFQLSFPPGERMDSARDMKISALTDKKSILVNEPDLKEELEGKVEEYYKNASGTFNNINLHLKPYTRKEVLALLSADARAEFEQLREEFRTDDDDKFEQSVYDTFLNEDEDTESEEDPEDEVEVEEKPTKTKKKKSTKKTSKKPKKEEDVEEVEEVEEEELDEDIDIDEDELFDE